MARNIIKTDGPVVLDGYQAVLKPSKFGYSLSAVVDSVVVDQLEQDRGESLKLPENYEAKKELFDALGIDFIVKACKQFADGTKPSEKK